MTEPLDTKHGWRCRGAGGCGYTATAVNFREATEAFRDHLRIIHGQTNDRVEEALRTGRPPEAA